MLLPRLCRTIHSTMPSKRRCPANLRLIMSVGPSGAHSRDRRTGRPCAVTSRRPDRQQRTLTRNGQIEGRPGIIVERSGTVPPLTKHGSHSTALRTLDLNQPRHSLELCDWRKPEIAAVESFGVMRADIDYARRHDTAPLHMIELYPAGPCHLR